MPMTVPNVPEWRREPGFEETPCWCVQVAKRPWPDCTGCGGSGVMGTVPIGVHAEANKRPMPAYSGDPRFDPRVRIAAHFGRNLAAWEADSARDRRAARLFAAAVVAVFVGSLVAALFIGY